MRAVGISQELPEDWNYINENLEKHKNHKAGGNVQSLSSKSLDYSKSFLTPDSLSESEIMKYFRANKSEMIHMQPYKSRYLWGREHD